MPRRSILLFAVLVLAIALGVAPMPSLRQRSGGAGGGGTPLVGGPFSLIDQNGKRVTEKDFLGKYMLVFFGYTYCPDICPTELQVMTAALDQMGPAGGQDHTGLHIHRPGTRYAGGAEGLCREFRAAPRGPHRKR